MSLAKLAVAEAEINRRSEAARKGGDLAGMQQAMAELTAFTTGIEGLRADLRGLMSTEFHGPDARGLLMPPIMVTPSP